MTPSRATNRVSILAIFSLAVAISLAIQTTLYSPNATFTILGYGVAVLVLGCAWYWHNDLNKENGN